MSMHKIPLTEFERKGLELHHLAVGTPSQLSDCFRIGMGWYKTNVSHEDSLAQALDDLLSSVSSAEHNTSAYKAALDALYAYRGE